MLYMRGTDLPLETQEELKRAYVHRYTKDHIPAWAADPTGFNGGPYPVQFESDEEWLANTDFPVTPTGAAARRSAMGIGGATPTEGDCFSRPTWPDNPELRNA